MIKTKKSSILDYFGEEDSVATPKAEERKPGNHIRLINTLYKAMNDLHITHNEQRTKDKSVHEALGGLYTAINDKLDRFVECIFGVYGPAPITFTSSAIEGDIVKYCEKLCDTIEMERIIYKESWIQNMIDTFAEDIAMTKYQLQYVKSNP